MADVIIEDGKREMIPLGDDDEDALFDVDIEQWNGKRVFYGKRIFGLGRHQWRLLLLLWGILICGVFPAIATFEPLMPNIIVVLAMEATRNTVFFALVIFLYSGDRQFIEESLLFYCITCIWILIFDIVELHDIVNTIDSTIILYTANMTVCAFLTTKWDVNNPNEPSSQSCKTIFILLLIPVAYVAILSHMCVVFVLDGINGHKIN